jgi:hypothetical protein
MFRWVTELWRAGHRGLLLWFAGVMFVTFAAPQVRLAGLVREDGRFEHLANAETRKVMLVVTVVGTVVGAILMGVIIFKNVQLERERRRRGSGD